MIGTRQLLTGIVVGAIVALLVHELFAYGLEITSWTVKGRAIGEVLITGALIGAIMSLTGATGRRR